MKTVSKQNIELVEKLAKCIKLRKEFELVEAELKSELRAIMGDEMVLEAGDYMVMLMNQNRKTVDMEAMLRDYRINPANYTTFSTVSLMRVIPKNEL
jgi:hypothetical protein